LALFDVVRQANAREDAAESMPVNAHARQDQPLILADATLAKK
jgi:hypothetical protein